MDGGGEEIAGDPEEVYRVEEDVGEGGYGNGALGDFETQPAGKDTDAQEESAASEGDGSRVQPTGPGERKEAARYQPQQGELEVAVRCLKYSRFIYLRGGHRSSLDFPHEKVPE